MQELKLILRGEGQSQIFWGIFPPRILCASEKGYKEGEKKLFLMSLKAGITNLIMTGGGTNMT